MPETPKTLSQSVNQMRLPSHSGKEVKRELLLENILFSMVEIDVYCDELNCLVWMGKMG